MVLLIAPVSALAANWTGPLTVERAFTEDSDLIVIYTVESHAYTSGCSPTAWVFSASSDARRSRVWATVLTALTTGQKIQLWYADSCGTWSYQSAASIMLHKGS
ncbi:MAG: hypothetical protein K0Q43_4949 [Ramlibacter sp.]|nr:hypothetical protein [Ramlibacter sp.]